MITSSSPRPLRGGEGHQLSIRRQTRIVTRTRTRLDMDGGALFDPHFKPDFNIDLLRSVNYICHLFVVSHDLAARTGGFRQRFDAAEDYDFIFRCVESAGQVYEIPRRRFTTGAATRTLRPAIRRASSTPSRQVREPLWPTMTVRESRRSVWKRAWTTGITTRFTGFRENRCLDYPE